MSNAMGVGTAVERVLKATIVANREDRPRFSKLVVYKRYHDSEQQVDWVQPTVLSGRWTRRGKFLDFEERDIAWNRIRPGRAPRELEDQWKAHVRAEGAKDAAALAIAKAAKEAARVTRPAHQVV